MDISPHLGDDTDRFGGQVRYAVCVASRCPHPGALVHGGVHTAYPGGVPGRPAQTRVIPSVHTTYDDDYLDSDIRSAPITSVGKHLGSQSTREHTWPKGWTSIRV